LFKQDKEEGFDLKQQVIDKTSQKLARRGIDVEQIHINEFVEKVGKEISGDTLNSDDIRMQSTGDPSVVIVDQKESSKEEEKVF